MNRIPLEPRNFVLFQGDSITDAFRLPKERSIAHQMGAGYAMFVAATLMRDHPHLQLRFDNRGISGDSLRSLSARWDDDCLALRPDIVTILVGINDTLAFAKDPAGQPIEEFCRHYDALIARTRSALPDTRIVLLEPFLLPVWWHLPEHTISLDIRRHAIREVAHQHGCAFVELQQPFVDASKHTTTEYWLFDGFHPTAAGVGLIARELLRVFTVADASTNKE
jgi:lysophospholipase L1-like esterase